MSAKENTLECPHGCKTSGRYPVASTIRGWKIHMNKSHGGWTDEMLANVAGAKAPSPNGKGLFESEVEKVLSGVPGEENRTTEGAESTAAAEGSSPQPPPEQVKRVQFKSKK